MQENPSTTIGRLMLRHRDNREETRKLEERYEEISGQIAELGLMVRDHRSTIHTTDEGFKSGYNDRTAPFNILEHLREIVDELREANEERQRVETCLREMGMDEYI